MVRPGSIPLVDGARPRRIAELLAVVWVLCLMDLSLTLWAHWFTPFYELNPLARSLLEGGRLQSLVFAKLSLTAVGTGIFWFFRHRRSAELAVWTVALAYVLLAVQWSTYTQDALAEVTGAA